MILLDDPLSAVDRFVAATMWAECIDGLLKETTVLLATHQLTYISRADYIYNLANGKIIEHGEPGELLTQGTSDISAEYESFIQGTKKPEESKKKNEDAKIEENGDEATEDEPLVETSSDKGDTRPQANLGTYHHMALYSGGYHCVLFILLLYALSVGLCQATIYWIGLWMSLLRNGKKDESIWSSDKTYSTLFILSSAGITIITVVRSLSYAFFVKRICDRVCAAFLDKLLYTKQSFFDTTPMGNIITRVRHVSNFIRT